jgi:hypothetical protein
MTFPALVPPVRRPQLVQLEDLSVVQEAIENAHGDQSRFAAMYGRLRQGYNFNDPQYFEYPGYERMKVS